MTIKKIFSVLLVAAAVFVPFTISAQVTIGSGEPPQEFSVLELISNNTQGFRLPQMTTAQRDVMTATSEFQNARTGAARGLQIFNTTTNCVETWNGTRWLAFCVTSPLLATPSPPFHAWVQQDGRITIRLGAASGGSSFPTYQWQSSANGSTGWTNVDAPTATNENLTTPALTAGSHRFFRRRASCSCATVYSNIVEVTIWARFNVAAPGVFATTYDGGMFYQWNRRVAWSAAPPFTSIPADQNPDNSANATATFWEPENDPCPPGWRIPALTDWLRLSDNSTVARSSMLFIQEETSQVFCNDNVRRLTFVDARRYNIPAAHLMVSAEGRIHAMRDLSSGSVMFRGPSLVWGVWTAGSGFGNFLGVNAVNQGAKVRCIAL